MKPRAAANIVAFLALAWAIAGVCAEMSGQQRAENAGRSLIGAPAPRLAVKTIDGETIDLGRLYGRQAVYLKFWATWCVPCRQQMPHFEHAYENAGPDLAVIAVNTGFNDSLDAVRDYRRKLGITMPIVIDDGRLGAAFNLRVTPQHIVIGRDGRIQYVGHLADARLDAALVAARTLPTAGGATARGATTGGATTGGADVPANTPRAIKEYTLGDHLPSKAPRLIDGPKFPLRDPDGRRRTVLVFLSPWCESYLATTRPEVSTGCRRMREEVSALEQAQDVRWLGIASGLWATPDDLRAYRKQYGIHIPLSLDESGTLFRSFNVAQVPTAMVVDPSGRLIRRIESADVQTPEKLRIAIEAP